MREKMPPHFAVFNLHVNRAGKRANQDVIHRYGRTAFMTVFPQLYRKGIMAIFNQSPTVMKKFWVRRVTEYVNEGRVA